MSVENYHSVRLRQVVQVSVYTRDDLLGSLADAWTVLSYVLVKRLKRAASAVSKNDDFIDCRSSHLGPKIIYCRRNSGNNLLQAVIRELVSDNRVAKRTVGAQRCKAPLSQLRARGEIHIARAIVRDLDPDMCATEHISGRPTQCCRIHVGKPCGRAGRRGIAEDRGRDRLELTASFGVPAG